MIYVTLLEFLESRSSLGSIAMRIDHLFAREVPASSMASLICLILRGIMK
jgi:hypothetical protein